MLLKASTSVQPVKCEIQRCLPFPSNCTIMETAHFPTQHQTQRFHQGKKTLRAGADGHSVVLVVLWDF